MPRFAANLSLLFTEHDFPDRFAAAADAGFRWVEFQFPYAWPADLLRARLDAAGLRAVLHNLPAGDWAAGDRGLACDPARAAEFRAGLPRAVAYAQALGVPRLNLLAGCPPIHLPADQVRQTFLDNLRLAAQAVGDAGLTLLVEPINTFDVPGFWLNRSQQAIDLLDEAGLPEVKLQFDLYHMQRMEGALAESLSRLLPRIGHIQFADAPGRHEPGTGEIDLDGLFTLLDQLGYAGLVGAEYLPQLGTAASLGWWQRWRPSGASIGASIGASNGASTGSASGTPQGLR